MSLEHAKALVERMKVDTAFAEKVNAIENQSARMEYIRQAGFNCTVADINAMSELSDEQLELASAAATNYTSCNSLAGIPPDQLYCSPKPGMVYWYKAKLWL